MISCPGWPTLQVAKLKFRIRCDDPDFEFLLVATLYTESCGCIKRSNLTNIFVTMHSQKHSPGNEYGYDRDLLFFSFLYACWNFPEKWEVHFMRIFSINSEYLHMSCYHQYRAQWWAWLHTLRSLVSIW